MIEQDIYEHCLSESKAVIAGESGNSRPIPHDIALVFAADRIAELEELLQKVLDDAEIGIVPRSHLDRIEAALQKWRKE